MSDKPRPAPEMPPPSFQGRSGDDTTVGHPNVVIAGTMAVRKYPIRPVRIPLAARLVLSLIGAVLIFQVATLWLVWSDESRLALWAEARERVTLATSAPQRMVPEVIEMSGFEPMARQDNPEMLRLLQAVWPDADSLPPGRAVMALYARFEGEWRAFAASDPQRVDTGWPQGAMPAIERIGAQRAEMFARRRNGSPPEFVFAQFPVARLFTPEFKAEARRQGWDFSDVRLSAEYRPDPASGRFPITALYWLAVRMTAVLVVLAPFFLLFGLLITGRVRHLRDVLVRIATGDYTARAKVWGADEIGQLADHCNLMAEGLQERARLRSEINVAAQVQNSLLPAAPPILPGIEIAATNLMSNRVGGDYYDFIRRGKHLWIVSGDISGHGLESGLLMAAARATVRLFVDEGADPVELLQKLNRRLNLDLSGGNFMTLAILVLDTETWRASYLSAGHEPALHGRGPVVRRLETTAPPLGLFPELALRRPVEEFRLEPGDRLLMPTDGLRECLDPDDRIMGHEPIVRVLRRPDLAAQDVVSELLGVANNHRRGRPWEDDLTLISLRLKAAV